MTISAVKTLQPALVSVGLQPFLLHRTSIPTKQLGQERTHVDDWATPITSGMQSSLIMVLFVWMNQTGQRTSTLAFVLLRNEPGKASVN